jgi:hypothetical protein
MYPNNTVMTTYDCWNVLMSCNTDADGSASDTSKCLVMTYAFSYVWT